MEAEAISLICHRLVRHVRDLESPGFVGRLPKPVGEGIAGVVAVVATDDAEEFAAMAEKFVADRSDAMVAAQLNGAGDMWDVRVKPNDGPDDGNQ